jgi:type III secretion system FlhB-like substrate exporter
MGKRKIATAIGYSPEDPAPALFATGRDRQAERIIAVAEQAGVAVVEDEALAVLLDSWAFGTSAAGNQAAGIRVKPGDFIPLWCWEAAAKILAFVIKDDYKENRIE